MILETIFAKVRSLSRSIGDMRRPAFLVCAMLIGLLTGVPVLALVGSGAVPSEALLDQAADNISALDPILDKVAKMNSYRFDAIVQTYGSKPKRVAGTLYYKGSGVRVEVRDYGIKSGSILVKQKDGGIRAQGGPGLFGMKMSLERDSRLLQLPNGLNVLDCDFLSLLRELKGSSARGASLKVSSSPLKLEWLGASAIVIEQRDSRVSPTGVAQRVIIDPVKRLPKEWQFFRDGRLFSSVRFENVETTGDIDDALFKI